MCITRGVRKPDDRDETRKEIGSDPIKSSLRSTRANLRSRDHRYSWKFRDQLSRYNHEFGF